MSYGPWLSQPRELSIFTRPRVLLREITATPPYALLSCFTKETFLSNKSVLTVLHQEDDETELKCLAAVLNSKLMTLFYKGFGVKGERKLFPKVVINNLREFPYPKTTTKEALANLAKIHDFIVSTKERSLNARMPHAREVISRQLEAYQDQLDTAVFSLFGASKREREIMEAALNPIEV